jgi:hypothetical protein
LLELESLLRRRHVELRSSGLERDLKIIACAVWRGRQGARASDAAATGTHLPPPCDSMTHWRLLVRSLPRWFQVQAAP